MDKRLFGIILAILILLSVVWVFSLEHISISAVRPVNNSYIKEGYNFSITANVSSDGNDDGVGYFGNVTIWFDNITYQITNHTAVANATAEVINFSIAGMADGSYQWGAYAARNLSGVRASAGNYTIIIDNTAPSGYSIFVTDQANTLQDTKEGDLNQTARISYLKNDTNINVTMTISELYPYEVRLYYSAIGNKFPDYGNGSNYTGMVNKSSATPWTFEGNIDKANLTDGTEVAFTIWINDSAGNVIELRNGQAGYNFTVDGTKPTSKMTMPTVTVIGAQRAIKIKCEGTDGGSGFETLWAVVKDPSGTLHSQSYTGKEKEFVFRGVDTGRAGEYQAYCKSRDVVGYTYATSEKSFVVLSSLGKGMAAAPEEAPKADVDISTLGAKGVISGKQGISRTIALDGEELHKVFFTKIGLDSVTLEIESELLRVELNLHESKEVDLDRDGEVDTKITLDSIEDEKASVSFERIKVTPKEGEEKEAAPGEAVSKAGLWITLIIIIVIVLIVYFVIKGKKKRY